MGYNKYAPIVITTLNRYKHFRNCLESLERCTGALNTDVFIGLDYPPTEKYLDGWHQINDYLNDKVNNHGFKKLIVIRRNRNYGIGDINSSNFGKLILDEIIEKYDCFITTEDDNIFSPNFLEYINQGLELFKNDDNCFSICGHGFDGLVLPNYDANVYLTREYSGWGVGFWSNKIGLLYDYLTIDYAKSIMSSWHKIMTLYKHEPRILNTVMLNIAINRVFGDTMIVCYQYLENKYSTFPVFSKVKNMGFDGSGTSIFKADNVHENQIIDQSQSFAIDDIDKKVLDDVQQRVESLKWFKRSPILNIVIFVRVLLYYLFRIDILYFEQKRRNKNLFK